MSTHPRHQGTDQELRRTAGRQQLDLEVSEGEILGLIGPNGAGKTTVFNSDERVPVARDERSVIFHGRDITGLGAVPHRAGRHARVFQQGLTFEGLSVLDNVLVGFHKSP